MSLVRRMDAAAVSGAASLGAAVLTPIRQGILAHRQSDGGFRGRSGSSDVWYTAFALRGLELTGGIPADVAVAAADWRARQAPPETWRGGLDHVTIAVLTQTASPDLPDLPSPSSCYDAFAAAVSADLLGRPVPACSLAAMERAQGFAEDATHVQAQVPATAAALVALRLGRRLPVDIRARGLEFLLGQQQPNGGMRVHATAPEADLLSTATAAWALAACLGLHRAQVAGLARFAVSCRLPSGFAAVPGDAESDPEYAWYGLTLLALLRRHAAPGPIGWLRRRGWWAP